MTEHAHATISQEPVHVFRSASGHRLQPGSTARQRDPIQPPEDTRASPTPGARRVGEGADGYWEGNFSFLPS